MKTRWRDWSELIRLPLAIGAMADPLAGALIAGASWEHLPRILAVMLAAACLYASGIILNDTRDRREDREYHPDRPIAAGRISISRGIIAAVLLLLTGAGLVILAGSRSAIAASLLVMVILAYDLAMKDVPIGVALRALCRALSMLMGMLILPWSEWGAAWFLSYLLIAVWLYALGIAIFADSAVPSGKPHRITGMIVSWISILLVVASRFFFPEEHLNPDGLVWVLVLVALSGFRMTQALLTPQPRYLDRAIRAGLLSIVLIDTALVAYCRDMPASMFVLAIFLAAFAAELWLRGEPAAEPSAGAEEADSTTQPAAPAESDPQ